MAVKRRRKDVSPCVRREKTVPALFLLLLNLTSFDPNQGQKIPWWKIKAPPNYFLFSICFLIWTALSFIIIILWSGAHVWMFLLVPSGECVINTEDYINVRRIWECFLDFWSRHCCFVLLFIAAIPSMINANDFPDSAEALMAPPAHRVHLSGAESPDTFSTVLRQVLTRCRHRNPETLTLCTSQLPSMRDVNIPAVGTLGSALWT